MKGMFQIILGSVLILSGLAVGVGVVVTTGNVMGAAESASGLITLGVGVAGFSRTIVDSVKGK